MDQQTTILLVDDDPAGRAILGLSLRRAGFRVLCAESGEEALRLLARKACDWLVTDARMRPMDGFQLSLKAKILCPKLRIVMISALHHEADSDGYPIERFFAKPVAAADLAACLKS
jgi:CheY-like chemotaxis protein